MSCLCIDSNRVLYRDLFERFLEVRGQVELSEETVRSSVAPLVQSLDAK